MADAKVTWEKVGEVEVRVQKDAVDRKVKCSVLSNGDREFVAYPKMSVLIDGIVVIYEPARKQPGTVL